jgi:hypothetical protein
VLGPIIARWREIALPDCWLAAGALAQTVWNDAFGLPPTHGLADVDLVYFDAGDLSQETEQVQAERIRALFPDLGVWIDAKNEARVHIWYAAKFVQEIAPYVSTEDAISTFPTTSTAVGLRPSAGGFDLVAPYGLADLLGLVVRANKKQITQAVYDAKVARWRRLWPGLRVIPWEEEN